MKTKFKYKLFQVPYFSKKEGEMEYGNYRKRFLLKRTCRYFKHKLRINDENL